MKWKMSMTPITTSAFNFSVLVRSSDAVVVRAVVGIDVFITVVDIVLVVLLVVEDADMTPVSMANLCNNL